MADQSMDFRYRVSGDREVAASLRSIQAGLSAVARKMDQTSRNAASAGRNMDGFLARVQRSVSGMARVASSAAGAVSTAGRGIASTAATVGRMSAGIARDAALTATAVSGLGTALGGKLAISSAEADQAMNSLQISLEQAAGSAAGGAQQLEFLNSTANRLGVSITELGNPYAQFANAITASGGSLQRAQETFIGLTEAGLALGATSDQIGRGLRQLQQIASKNKITQEDISTLSESIPGAQGLIAQSLGVTTEALAEMTKAGADAGPLFENLGGFLSRKFGAAALKAGDDFQSAKDRFKNAILGLKITIGRAGVSDALKRLLDTMARLIGAFNDVAGQGVGERLGASIDRLTTRIERAGRKAIAGWALLTRGPMAYRDALVRLNDDGQSSIATLGSGFTSLAPALAFMDSQRYSGFASMLLKIRDIAINLFEAVRGGARAAAKAFLDFMDGFFYGNGVKGIADSFEGLSQRLRALSGRFEAFANTGAFETLGKKARYAFNFVTSYTRALFSDTRVVVNDSLRYLYSKLPFGVRQMASAMAGAFHSVINLAKALAPIFQPVVRELKKFFGIADVGMGIFKSRSEKLASPFLLLSMIINRNLSNGKIGKFAEAGRIKMEKLIATTKKVVKILKLFFNPSKKNDAALLKLAPKMGQVLLDLRGVILWLIDHIKQTYIAVKAFWESWGPAIKKVIGYITSLLDKVAPLFGLKSGKQVLLLLVFLQLVGILPIVIGFLVFIGKAVAFAFFLASLSSIVGILGGVAAGTITWQAALVQIANLVKGMVLGKIFGLWYTAWNLLVGAFQLGKGTVLAIFNTLRGTVVALFQAIRTMSFGPIITGLKNFGVEAVRIFKVFDGFFGGWISKIWMQIFRGTGGVLKFIFGGFWSLLVRIGALIASSFAAAPVATVALIAALVLIVIGLAYKFRDQIEAFFQGISDWLYKAVESLFGTRVANFLAGIVNTLTAPFREGWRLLMETIDSLFENGFTGTLKKIWGKLSEWGEKVKNFFKWLFGFKTTVDVKTTGAEDTSEKPAYANGGRVRGKGGPRSDSILAWLSNGEYVINAAAARVFGPLLDAINYGGSRVRGAFSGGLPAFATGGRVRMPAGGIQPLGRAAPAGGGGDGMRPFNAFFGGDPFGAQLYTDAPEDVLKRAVRQASRGKVRRGTPAAATR